MLPLKWKQASCKSKSLQGQAWGPQLILGNPGGNGVGEISLGRSSLFENETGRDRPGRRMVES